MWLRLGARPWGLRSCAPPLPLLAGRGGSTVMPWCGRRCSLFGTAGDAGDAVANFVTGAAPPVLFFVTCLADTGCECNEAAKPIRRGEAGAAPATEYLCLKPVPVAGAAAAGVVGARGAVADRTAGTAAAAVDTPGGRGLAPRDCDEDVCSPRTRSSAEFAS